MVKPKLKTLKWLAVVVVSLACGRMAADSRMVTKKDGDFMELCSSEIGTFYIASANYISKFTPRDDAVTQLFVRDADLWNFRCEIDTDSVGEKDDNNSSKTTPTIKFNRNGYNNTVGGHGWAQRSLFSNNTKALASNPWNRAMKVECETVCAVRVITINPDSSGLIKVNSSACNPTSCSLNVNDVLQQSDLARTNLFDLTPKDGLDSSTPARPFEPIYQFLIYIEGQTNGWQVCNLPNNGISLAKLPTLNSTFAQCQVDDFKPGKYCNALLEFRTTTMLKSFASLTALAPTPRVDSQYFGPLCVPVSATTPSPGAVTHMPVWLIIVVTMVTCLLVCALALIIWLAFRNKLIIRRRNYYDGLQKRTHSNSHP